MPVQSVFVSSVVDGFEKVRDAAEVGATRAGYYVVRSENVPANPRSPRRALLDEVRKADVYLLIMGRRYGTLADTGKSPTEDEFDEAVANGKQVVVLIHEGEMEPDQQEFLARVRGKWGDGRLSASFADEHAATLAAALALTNLQTGSVEDGPAAQEKVLELLARSPQVPSSPIARLALVPLRSSVLLDPVMLQGAALESDLTGLFRESGVVPQAMGIEAAITGLGVNLTTTGGQTSEQPTMQIGTSGSIHVARPVTASDNRLGFAAVDPARLAKFIDLVGDLAIRMWDRIDSRDEVANVAVSMAIEGAQFTTFGPGFSTSVGMGVPQHIIVPGTPIQIPKGELGKSKLSTEITAAVRLVFHDAGALSG